MGKKITLEDLAGSIERLTRTVADLAGAVGKRFDEIDRSVATGFRETEERLTEIWSAVNRIEKDLLGDHARRIERLEQDLAALKK